MSVNNSQHPCHVWWHGCWQMVSQLPYDPFTIETAHPHHTAPPQTTSMRICAPTSANDSQHPNCSPTSCSTTTNDINEDPCTHISEQWPAPETTHPPHSAPPRTTSMRICTPMSMNNGKHPCHICWYGHWKMVSKLPHDPFAIETAHPCHAAPPQMTSIRNYAPTSLNNG